MNSYDTLTETEREFGLPENALREGVWFRGLKWRGGRSGFGFEAGGEPRGDGGPGDGGGAHNGPCSGERHGFWAEGRLDQAA